MATYGLQADVQANQGKNVQLYTPGQTQLGKGDVFLGGTGTGVADSSLNGATRVWGADRGATANAYDAYLSGQKAMQQQIPQVKDNSALIQQMFDQQKAGAIAQLKQSIANSQAQYQDTIASTPGTYDKLRNTVQQNYNDATGAYQNTINQAPGQYQPLRDQASAAGYKNINSLQEMLANNGQQGGVNRTETTAVNSNTQNNINALNAQQQNTVNNAQSSIDNLNKDKSLKLADLATQQQQVIDQANTAIQRLQASGSLQEAQTVAQNAQSAIQALVSESNRVQSTGYQYSQDAIKNAQNEAQLTGMYNGSQTLAASNANRTFGLQEAGVTGSYNGQQTLAAKDAQQQQALSLAQLMGTYNGSPTLAAKTADETKAIQLAQLLGNYNGQDTLGKQQLTADTAYKNAALAASQARASGSGGLTSVGLSAAKYQNDQASQQALASAMQGLQSKASGGMTRSELLAFVNSNAGDLQANHVPVQELYNWAAKNFTWDKNGDGTWYDTAAK